MLHSIGLSQYQEQFTKKNVDGKELLAMQKQDFIVSSEEGMVNFSKQLLKNYAKRLVLVGFCGEIKILCAFPIDFFSLEGLNFLFMAPTCYY